MRAADWNDLAITDGLPFDSLKAALKRTIHVFKSSNTIPKELQFGQAVVSKDAYVAALEELDRNGTTPEAFFAYLKNNFTAHEVYGGDNWGEVLVTGYYEPAIPGSRKPTEKFSQPIYGMPNDLVVVDIGAYADRYPELEPIKKLVTEQKSRTGTLRGRLEKRTAQESKVTPYYERAEIDGDGALEGKGLEIAYTDPVDAFFLQIQGSGLVNFPDGKKIKVGYAAQNGAAYVPIGKFLKDKIPLEEMSMQRIRAELERLSRFDRLEMLFQNPSYVFFKTLPGESLTYSGAEVTAGRTIAADQSLFPKGALAFLDIEEPRFVDPQAAKEASWEKRGRFVFDQDTGGAIRGTGHVDLYFGEGDEAGRRAGVMKRSGRLYYFMPKDVSTLRRNPDPARTSRASGKSRETRA
jgi:membrane-bound lytic murein transglycosylase A